MTPCVISFLVYSKIGVYWGIHNFSIFALIHRLLSFLSLITCCMFDIVYVNVIEINMFKLIHRLWVHIRIASMRRF